MLKLGFLTITGCSFWNIFFPSQGGPWSKRLCRPYAYVVDMPSFHASWCCLNQKNDWIHASYLCKSSLAIISYYFCDQNHHIALRLLTIKLQFFIYQQMKPQIQPQSRRCGSKIQSNGENFTAPTVILKYFKYKNILDNERRMSFHQGNR